jgi:hypothetical protein
VRCTGATAPRLERRQRQQQSPPCSLVIIRLIPHPGRAPRDACVASCEARPDSLHRHKLAALACHRAGRQRPLLHILPGGSELLGAQRLSACTAAGLRSCGCWPAGTLLSGLLGAGCSALPARLLGRGLLISWLLLRSCSIRWLGLGQRYCRQALRNVVVHRLARLHGNAAGHPVEPHKGNANRQLHCFSAAGVDLPPGPARPVCRDLGEILSLACPAAPVALYCAPFPARQLCSSLKRRDVGRADDVRRVRRQRSVHIPS